MTIYKLPGSAIESNTITITQIQTTAVTNIVTQSGPRVSSLIYPGNDTAGNTVGGQTVYINGSGFETNNAIYINGNAVPSKTFISASNLSFTTPALAAGIYPVYIINTDSGSTAIFIPGYISSAEPAWVTSAGSLNESQDELSAWSYSLSATGDAPITYALAGGSSLPTGVSLAANGLISGTITSPSGNTTTYTFSVIATDAQNQDSTRQFTATTTTGEGVLFANNVLLIHADGTNNQNNHTFLDSSNNNFTITRNGNATQGTFSPFSQTGWSGYFDGSSYLNAGTTASNFLCTGSANGITATFEAWVNPTAYNTGASMWMFSPVQSKGATYFNFGVASGKVRFYWYDGGYNNVESTSTSDVPLNTWTHIAVTISGSTIKIYVNGVLNTTSATYTGVSAAGLNQNDNIGVEANQPTYFSGYISNYRLNNTVVYSSAFTPSTTSLTAISGTRLLTCQSNRFIDNSTNAFAITVTGTPTIQAFSPFAPTVAYSTANVGGSGYFDGTGDYLNIATSTAFGFGTGDFTIEFWTLWGGTLNSLNGGTFIELRSAVASEATVIYISTSGVISFYDGPANVEVSSGVTITKQWTHIAVARASGVWRIFVNGTLAASRTSSSDLGSTKPCLIGQGINGSTTAYNGYISNLRVVKGTAVYTSAFTPPTAPLTNIANTSLLCNFTNAGIFDQTAKNILETVGDAKVSTAQYKYGTGSMYFDGSGDYLTVRDNPMMQMGSGNFTIEFWWYPNSIAGYQTPYDKGYNGSSGLVLQTGNGDGRIIVYASGSAVVTSNTAVTVNNWTHMALVRNSTSLTLYQNGVSVGSATNSTNFSNTSITGIGGNVSGAIGYPINGYIDDLRITKGYARYTSTFTPPTSALKDK